METQVVIYGVIIVLFLANADRGDFPKHIVMNCSEQLLRKESSPPLEKLRGALSG